MIVALLGLFMADDWVARTATAPSAPGVWDDLVTSLRHGLMITCVWATLALFGTRELGKLLEAGGYRPVTGAATVVNVVLAFVPWMQHNTLHDSERISDLTLVLLVLSVLIVFMGLVRRRETEGAGADLAFTMLMIVYIGVLGSFVPRLRLAERGSPWLLLYVVLVVKTSDIAAYFTGLAVGRRKLIPWLSPGKTIEGLCGGVFFSALIAAGLSWAMRPLAPTSAWPAPAWALLTGVLLAMVGQTGDLIESLLKRSVRAKDSGAVVPSFGGLLDILDSLMLAVPLGYWLLLQ